MAGIKDVTDMSERELLSRMNNTPSLQSTLHDLDMLTDQTIGSNLFIKTLIIASKKEEL